MNSLKKRILFIAITCCVMNNTSYSFSILRNFERIFLVIISGGLGYAWGSIVPSYTVEDKIVSPIIARWERANGNYRSNPNDSREF